VITNIENSSGKSKGGKKKTGGCKPGSVRFHAVAISLWLPLPAAYSDLPEMPQNFFCGARATPAFLFGLASSGACTAASVARSAVSSYLAISPLPVTIHQITPNKGDPGGLFSVALSIPLPVPAVSRHFAL